MYVYILTKNQGLGTMHANVLEFTYNPSKQILMTVNSLHNFSVVVRLTADHTVLIISLITRHANCICVTTYYAQTVGYFFGFSGSAVFFVTVP